MTLLSSPIDGITRRLAGSALATGGFDGTGTTCISWSVEPGARGGIASAGTIGSLSASGYGVGVGMSRGSGVIVGSAIRSPAAVSGDDSDATGANSDSRGWYGVPLPRRP